MRTKNLIVEDYYFDKHPNEYLSKILALLKNNLINSGYLCEYIKL